MLCYEKARLGAHQEHEIGRDRRERESSSSLNPMIQAPCVTCFRFSIHCFDLRHMHELLDDSELPTSTDRASFHPSSSVSESTEGKASCRNHH
jgi:hypothetical protein